MGPHKTPNKSYNNDLPSTRPGKLASIESGNYFPTFPLKCPKILWTRRLVEYAPTFYLYSICRIPRISWVNYSDVNLTSPLSEFLPKLFQQFRKNTGEKDFIGHGWFHGEKMWHDMGLPCTKLQPWGRSVELSWGGVMIENVGGRGVVYWWLGVLCLYIYSIYMYIYIVCVCYDTYIYMYLYLYTYIYTLLVKITKLVYMNSNSNMFFSWLSIKFLSSLFASIKTKSHHFEVPLLSQAYRGENSGLQLAVGDHGVKRGTTSAPWGQLQVALWRYTRWWFHFFFIFTPTWGKNPIWLIFFRWVETTNQYRYTVYRNVFPDKTWGKNQNMVLHSLKPNSKRTCQEGIHPKRKQVSSSNHPFSSATVDEKSPAPPGMSKPCK